MCREHEASLEVNDVLSLTLAILENDTAVTNETLPKVSEYKLPISGISTEKHTQEIHKKETDRPTGIIEVFARIISSL